MGCLIWPDRKFNFLFWSQGLRDRSRWVVPLHGSSHCVSWVKIKHTGYLMKWDDPDGSSHFVSTQFFMYLRSETYQNTSKCSQMASNQLKTLKRLRKLLELAETSILAYLMRFFKFNLLNYLKHHTNILQR